MSLASTWTLACETLSRDSAKWANLLTRGHRGMMNLGCFSLCICVDVYNSKRKRVHLRPYGRAFRTMDAGTASQPSGIAEPSLPGGKSW